MIAVVDYHKGNLKSVERGLIAAGADARITDDARTIERASAIVLPGVGAFADASATMIELGQMDVIRSRIDAGVPFLGICLGLQLLFEESEESPGVKGLGILKGKILRIPENGDLKIPHMGWNSLKLSGDGRLFKDLPEDPYVYFVHSYYLKAEENIVKARTWYSTDIDASVEKGNVFACQFHPEKSSRIGLQILKNFAELEGGGC